VRFIALATDYDGTIARDGVVDPLTLKALQARKAAGKKLVMVTGRELPDLRQVFDHLDVFDAVVAENGALLYLPGTAEERALAPPPSPALVEALKAAGVEPLSVGRSIVATWEPHEAAVRAIIHKLGLEWQVIFNKGAVMCLPPGVDKASGLAHALAELRLAPLDVVGAGDAENDCAFLADCGCAVAVSNALRIVKDMADLVTRADHGAGVAELIGGWLTDPAATFAAVRRCEVTAG